MTRSLSRTSSAAASPEALKRASSSSSGGSPAASAAGDDNIDQRAELFIANFYRQMRMGGSYPRVRFGST
ncbi:unnamed protein product [Miscanthus lutarioriparius]|uniref:Uncharacterized protein n=1 Tax=Miscanthus lutarioriparius TaxID=422564 RepID=A0A811NKM2_9POAL|nr:unnamed protein product [Miscanthus lutarioriparius]